MFNSMLPRNICSASTSRFGVFSVGFPEAEPPIDPHRRPSWCSIVLLHKVPRPKRCASSNQKLHPNIALHWPSRYLPGTFFAKPRGWVWKDVPGKMAILTWFPWKNNKAGETKPLFLRGVCYCKVWIKISQPHHPIGQNPEKKKHLQKNIDRCFWGIFLMQDLCWITLHNFISENNPLRVLALRLLALKKIKPFLVAQPSFGTWFAIETLGKHSHHKGIDHLFRDVGSKPLRFVENSGNFLWRLCRFCCDTTSCRPPFGSICQHESVKICQILSFFWKKNEDDHHLQWPFAKPQWDGWIWNGNLSNVKQNPCDG